VHRYVATVSYFPSGELAEIFINNGRAGSHIDAAASDSAVLASLGLQYGISPRHHSKSVAARQPGHTVITARRRARPCRRREWGLAMSVIRFPLRRIAAILVMRERNGGWLTLVGSNGWLFGSRAEALQEAAWLARNLDLPVRA
jgi:hypothetical protein